MATRNFVPRADGEGTLGKESKHWKGAYVNEVHAESVDAASAVLTSLTLNGKDADIVADSAPAHNSIYRGKDLTDAWKAGTVSARIQDGTFHDIFVGDYINMPIAVDGVTYQVKWEVADLDYYLHTGDQECTAHHALMFPSKTVQTNVQMNSTDTTAGGYVGSAMWKTVIPKYSAAIQAAFGSDHVLKHRELLTDSLNTTVASAGGFGWTGCAYWGSAPWYDAIANIPNEVMIYGCAPAS